VTPQLQIPSAPTPAGTVRLFVDNHFRTLRVTGPIDASTADRFGTSLRFAFELGEPVRVDMSGVPSLGPSGIRALLSASTARRVIIVDPSAEVREALGRLGLLGYFGVADLHPG
jgi:anti-anti-sigma regulatory factor